LVFHTPPYSSSCSEAPRRARLGRSASTRHILHRYPGWLPTFKEAAFHTGWDSLTNGVAILTLSTSHRGRLRPQSARSVFLAELLASLKELVAPPTTTSSCAKQVAFAPECLCGCALAIAARTTSLSRVGAEVLGLGGSLGQGCPWHRGQKSAPQHPAHQSQRLAARDRPAG
jgi:hypothetical protein